MGNQTEDSYNKQGQSRSTSTAQTDGQEEPYHRNQSVQAQPERYADRLAGFSPVFEMLVALSTVGTLVLLIFQTCHMEEGIRLTRESNKLTQDSLIESKRSADAAIAAIEEGRRQFDLQRADAIAASSEERQRFETALEEQRRSAEAEQELARQNLMESKKSLDVSERSMRESLRAQVFVETVSIDFDKVPQRIVAKLRNTGSLPAERFSVGAQYNIGKPSLLLTTPRNFTRSANPLSPGSTYDWISSVTLPADPLVEVKEGTLPFRIWIVFEYGDRLTPTYGITSACFSFDGREKKFTNCRADDYPSKDGF